MRLVATRRLEPGTRLGRDVPGPGGTRAPLLRAGVKITERQRQALLGAGINAVYVEDDLSEGIVVPRVLSDKTRERARGALDRALEDARVALGKGEPVRGGSLAEIADAAEAIAAEVAACGEAAVALADLAGADSYTLEHSIDVTVAGLLVGRRLFRQRGRVDFRGDRAFDRIDKHLTQLGIGLMLHDIGKLAVPLSVLHKPGALDEAEWELIRRHPLDGIEMLRTDLIGVRAKAVVRSHHERWDGAGYPDGLRGEEIFQFARIASVADVFDAVTSERPYATAAPQEVGVAVIREGSGTAFDPEVVASFLEVVPPHPPGSEVELADGRAAIVVSARVERMHLPVVRVHRNPDGEEVEPYELDLAGAPELAPVGAPVPQRPRPAPEDEEAVEALGPVELAAGEAEPAGSA